MTRIGICADVHAGNHKRFGGAITAGVNERCEQILQALAICKAKSSAFGCTGLFIAGDLVDHTLGEQIVARLQRILQPAGSYPVMGNHDMMSAAQGDHFLGPLSPVVNRVLDEPYVQHFRGLDVVCAPFQPGDAREWLPASVAKAMAEATAPVKILITHVGIEAPDTEIHLLGAHDAVPEALLKALCDKHGLKAVFAGNWHKHRIHSKAPWIVQVGALCPTGFDNEGVEPYGPLLIYDSDSDTVTKSTIPGPRFVDMEVGDERPAVPAGSSLYVRIKASPIQVSACNEQIAEWKADGTIAGGEVILDASSVRTAARASAAAARSASTLEEAIIEYVKRTPLAEDVDRGRVLEMSRKYLGV